MLCYRLVRFSAGVAVDQYFGYWDFEFGFFCEADTDGVSEAADADRRLFGTQRLIETLGASDGSPEGALNDVLAAVSKFSEGEPQADDLTLLCFGPTVPMSAVKPG